MHDELARYVLSLEPGAPPLRRAEVYRRLVRESLSSVLATDLPVTAAILGADGFAGVVAEFLDGGGPRTSIYREVPGDLVVWAIEHDHPLADLMHYEWLEIVAGRHPADLDRWSPPSDGRVHPNPTLQAGVYRRPVHRMSRTEPSPPPFDAPSAYLVWRRPVTDEVVFHRAGLLVARALELAASEPRPIAVLAELLTAEVPSLEAAVIGSALGRAFSEITERDGLR